MFLSRFIGYIALLSLTLVNIKATPYIKASTNKARYYPSIQKSDLSEGSIVGQISIGPYISTQYFYVSLFTLNSCGQKEFVRSTSVTQTGEFELTFSFTNLQSGIYFLKLDPITSSGYVDEYFHHKQSLDEATAITVTGNTTTSISTALQFGGEIRGTVQDALTGDPAPNTYFSIFGKNNFSGFSQYAVGVVASDGSYIATGLPAGEYLVQLYDQNTYVPQFYSNSYSPSLATFVSVTAGSITSGINFSLTRGAQISGVITEAGTNLPVPYAQVYARAPTVNVLFPIGRADANGAYTTWALPPENYTLEFFSIYHLPQFYNGQPNANLANTVTLTASGIVPNINASLQRGGNITGTLTFTDGTPTYSVDVQLLDAATGQVVSAGSSFDGRYEFSRTPSGSYKVRFGTAPKKTSDCYDIWGGYYNNKSDFASADTITLTAPQVISNINGTLAFTATASIPTPTPTVTPTHTPTVTPAPTPTVTPTHTPASISTATPNVTSTTSSNSTSTPSPTTTLTRVTPSAKIPRAYLPFVAR